MKNKLMWFYYSWDSIMNLKYNPFRFIGNMSLQCYFMLALSIIWSVAFCGLIAGWMNIIPLVYGNNKKRGESKWLIPEQKVPKGKNK
jgi:hypothetical protein